MDPQNAEAYQILGLGQYSSGQYIPAVHAFMESLARDPENPDTYYDLGITLHASGNLTAATTPIAMPYNCNRPSGRRIRTWR